MSRDLEPSFVKTWTLGDQDLIEVLRRMVNALCPAWFDAESREEVFQETFLRLARRADVGDFGEPCFNSSFLWQTATNVKREKVRTLGRQFQREASAPQDASDAAEEPIVLKGAAAPEPSPEDAAQGRQVGQAIRDCLSRLADERRRAVTLRLAGFRVLEIAERLAWRAKSAENRVYRGLEQLRSCLAFKGVTP